MMSQFLTRLYSQEEVQQILNIAVAQHYTSETELSYAQLLEIVQELQILPETLELAENKWLNQQEATENRRKFDASQRSRLRARTSRYIIINACLVAINFLTGFSVPWSLYVLILWGMVRGLDTWRFFYQPQGQANRRVFQSWKHK
ncbi:2TM domain-containing protein [Nostoc sp.]|uniref:2TM domain-containing protein n=1 Tax=Nostoc sp. TaxID=1180 RepID=UPI002FF99C28